MDQTAPELMSSVSGHTATSPLLSTKRNRPLREETLDITYKICWAVHTCGVWRTSRWRDRCHHSQEWDSWGGNTAEHNFTVMHDATDAPACFSLILSSKHYLYVSASLYLETRKIIFTPVWNKYTIIFLCATLHTLVKLFIFCFTKVRKKSSLL